MKLSKAKLRQIIKEEIAAQTGPFPSPESMAAFEQSNGEEWDDPAVEMIIAAYEKDPRGTSVPRTRSPSV